MKQVKALVIAAACLVGLGLLWNSLGANALLAPDAAAVTPPANAGRFSRAGLEVRADAPSIYSLLADLQEEALEPTNTPALPEVTNTPARPGPEPTNTPAPPEGQSASTIEGAAMHLHAPEGIEQGDVGPSVAEQRIQDEEHFQLSLERAEQLRRAGVRFQVTQPETRQSESGGHRSTGTISTGSPAPEVEGESCSSVADGQSLAVEPAASDGGLPEESPNDLADQQTFYPIADSTVLQAVPTLNAGSTIDMWVGYEHCTEGLMGIVRSLVRFDVSGIPAGASVEDATLRVYLMNSCDMGERTHEVTVYRTSASWSESSVTWNNQPSFAESYGSDWIPSQTWGWYSFDVTDLVQGWVGGSFSNHGLMLRGPESSGNDSARLGFFTRDYQDDPALRPQLVVEYSLNTSPYAPRNPSPADGATGVSTTADLSWTGGDPDPGDTVTYDVYFEADDSTPDDLLCNDVSATSCDPGTLAYDTNYYWYVVATDDQGASTTGNTWEFTTGPEPNRPPYDPSNPSPADGATDQGLNVDLSWTGGDPDPGDMVTYDVYFEANDSTPDDLLCNDVSTTSCDPGTLNPNTHYHWYVVATDDQNASTAGPTWDFTTGEAPNSPPYVPGNPSPADGATNQGLNMDLSWTGGDPDPGDTVTYDVYFEANDSTPDQLLCSDVPTTYCDPDTLSADTHYYWYVRATDDHGASNTSPTWDFITTEGGTAERCVNILLNPQMDVVEFGDGTGSAEPWAIAVQNIYYTDDVYQSAFYSLLMVDETEAWEGPPDENGWDPDWEDSDAFGQAFQAPPNLTYMRISYNRLYADANSTDRVFSKVWTLDDEGFLVEPVVGVSIGESPEGWSNRYWDLDPEIPEESELLEELSGRWLALMFEMYSDQASPGELILVDDAQVYACYTPDPSPVHLPLSLRQFTPPTGPTPEPEPICSPREPDTINQRGSVDVGATCGGSLGPTDQKDYYSVNLDGVSAVRLRLFNLPSGTNWDAVIWEVGVYDTPACHIGTPGDQDKETDCTLNPAKSYFVLVSRGPQPAGGSYNMSLTRQ